MINRRLLAVLSMLAPTPVAGTALAAGICGSGTSCEVSNAVCIDNLCRLAPPGLLFPANANLNPLPLLEPADRAVVSATDGPSFRWVYPAGADLVAVAIFSTPPRFAASGAPQLDDPAEQIWLWSSSPDGNGPGSTACQYAKGHQYQEDKTKCNAVAPPKLETGKVYYWGAWGWTAGSVTARSELRAFSTGDEMVTGTFCSDDSYCGPLPGARCLTDKHFCVIDCASDADCFAGEACDLSHLSASEPYGLCKTPPECTCRENEVCDPDVKICYRGAPALDQKASGCACPLGSGGGPNPSGPFLCAPVLGFALLRRRQRRSPARTQDARR